VAAIAASGAHRHADADPNIHTHGLAERYARAIAIRHAVAVRRSLARDTDTVSGHVNHRHRPQAELNEAAI